MVGGCLAQKDRDGSPRAGRRTSTSCSAPTTSHRAAELLARGPRRDGPVIEILGGDRSDDAADVPVRPAGAPRGRLGRPGSPSRSAATTPAPSASCRPCGARRSAGRSTTSSPRSAAAAADGVTEVTLLGQNVNSYGRDLTLATTRLRRRGGRLGGRGAAAGLFADLLRAVGAVDGIRRVRYTSPHPKDLRPETIAAMAATPAVCEHLHLPLQSGSDRVLAAMHRGYTAERYLDRLAAARAAVDDLAVTTDLIVGFPGETDADFERTLEVVAEAAYDSAYTFIFSPRPGTEAAELVDRVRPRRGRGRAVRAAAGRGRAVGAGPPPGPGRSGRGGVVEGPSKRDPAVLTGRTRQNKLVHFPTPSPVRPGSYAEVSVTAGAPHHLRGELVAVTAPPGTAPASPSPSGDVTIEPAPFDGDVARALVAALEADLDIRYAADDVEFAHLEPDHAMLAIDPSEVEPPRGAFLVAWLDGVPIGCAAVRPAPTGEQAAAEIKRMFVAPEARGRGVSRALLGALEAAATSFGYRRMVLETGLRQPEAMALYESAGYQPIANYGGYRAFPMSRCYAKALRPG